MLEFTKINIVLHVPVKPGTFKLYNRQKEIIYKGKTKASLYSRIMAFLDDPDYGIGKTVYFSFESDLTEGVSP